MKGVHFTMSDLPAMTAGKHEAGGSHLKSTGLVLGFEKGAIQGRMGVFILLYGTNRPF